jgi:hypothetical protein
MTEFVGCATGDQGGAEVTLDGAFTPRVDYDRKPYQRAGLRIERTGLLSSFAERFVGFLPKCWGLGTTREFP